MAQKVQVTRVSDLDGSPADENVTFAVDGTEYEIDLSAAQAQEMRGELAPFTAKARRLPRRRKRNGRPGVSRNDLPEIREYARSRGYDINERGRVPGRIIAEYDELKKLSSK